ncbi:serine/threonine-protein kinase, partial [Nostoc sp. NIES-2111]
MQTPTVLNNRYRVIRILAAGGFGETFLAEDTQMPSGRRCLIKKLKPVANNPQIYQLVQERFRREAAILEELGDGCNQIPKLYAYFVENDEFFLVQEYIEGETLQQKLQQGLLSEASVKEIISSILPILDYVHSKRIVHRDIKPDNILIRHADGKPVLIDFGAVKETMGTVMTASGNSDRSIVIGTPGFMPSEQLAGRPVFS